ncbi:hypothetical protein RFI_07545, partial [Reticulomyxa filosa]
MNTTTKEDDEDMKVLQEKRKKKEFESFFKEIKLDVDEHFLEMDFEHQLKQIHRISQDTTKRNHAIADRNPFVITEDVDLGTLGWKQRYYRSKFNFKFDEKPPLFESLCHEYIKGLCWVMLYYYQGCPSWEWYAIIVVVLLLNTYIYIYYFFFFFLKKGPLFKLYFYFDFCLYYPFYYAPFASDLANCSRFDVSMTKGKPLSPFGQLMGVLPASSGQIALPKKFYSLMMEPTSPIIDFYPTDFKLDLNGKMFNWQAVTLLPFINEKRLLKAIEPLEKQLLEEEQRMNRIGDTLLYINTTHNLRKEMLQLYATEGAK